MILTLTLPWPPKELSPNARQHYMALHRAKAAFKKACFFAAKEQGAPKLSAKRLHAHFVFYPPTRRRIDEDNCVARMKSGIDGLALALGVDDSRWHMSYEVADDVGSKVVVTIWEAP